MPKVKLEIRRQVEITRDESIEVEVNVPGHLLGDSAEFNALSMWAEAELKKIDSALTQACVGNWDVDDESETFSVDDVDVLDDED